MFGSPLLSAGIVVSNSPFTGVSSTSAIGMNGYLLPRRLSCRRRDRPELPPVIAPGRVVQEDVVGVSVPRSTDGPDFVLGRHLERRVWFE